MRSFDDLTVIDRERLLALAQLMKIKRESTPASPITPIDRNRPLELSFAQQRLWFLTQFEEVSQAYHMAIGLRLTGNLDRTALRRAFDHIIARHEALRTTFSVFDGRPVQVIGLAENGFLLQEQDLRQTSDAAAELYRLATREVAKPFDLEQGPLIRGRLAQMADDDHVLFLTIHHIVSDGWSISNLFDELSALYRAYLYGEAASLPDLPVQYADYAAWQRQWLSGDFLQRQVEYWKRVLDGAPEQLALPTDRLRPAKQDYSADTLEVELDVDLTRDLKALSRRHGTTLFMTLLAGWATLLARHAGQDEVVIGSPVANRMRSEIEPLIGFFVNTLAMRIDISGSPTVGELLARIKASALGAQQHQYIPFERVVEIVQPSRKLSRAPVFQVMFSWQNAPEGALTLPRLTITTLTTPNITTQFDLSLSLQEAGQKIVGGLIYATALFDRSTAQRYLERLRALLKAMATYESQAVDRLPLLDDAERRQVLVEWNATKADYSRHLYFHELFETQVRKSPNATALVYEEKSLSYSELNAQANRLAAHLRGLGVGPEARVAICMERSIEMVVALLATLKAGGAYAPIDPAYPPERLAYMLEDSSPVVLLTHTPARAALPRRSPAIPILDLDIDVAQWADQTDSNPGRFDIGLNDRHLAYIIYTSGSTGLPKGAMNERRSVVNRLLWMQQAYQLEAHDAVLQKTPFSFDVSVWEFFWPLLVGGRLVMARPDGHKDPVYLARLIQQQEITTVHFVPSMLQAFLEYSDTSICRNLVRVICSGESLPTSLARHFYERLPETELHNLYGPTEAAVDVTAWNCRHGANGAGMPIGRPIANTHIYILDPHGQPAPIGVAGELYIGGVQVGRGYLNRPDLACERFIPDTFSHEPGARVYRTGDLGRWLPDGSIEFLGRTDFQIKIRGFRVELGEIEVNLAGYPGVREAVALAYENGDSSRRLVVYYTGEEVGAEALRAHVSTRLPEYMAPWAYVHMEALPLTPNGKLDRRALPAPKSQSSVKREYEPPVGEFETRLALIWAKALNLDRVGRHDNFFELGGHSLLGVTMIELMRREGLRANVRMLFTAPTLQALAKLVDSGDGDSGGAAEVETPPNLIPPGCRAITPEMLPLVNLTQGEIDSIVAGVSGGAANVQDIYPLTALQEGLLFHYLMSARRDAYLLPCLLAFDTRERLDAFVGALRAVIARHDILRTSVVWEGLPNPVQVVWREAILEIEQIAIEPSVSDAARRLRERFDPRDAQLDIRRAPLMRCIVAQDESKERWVLLWMSHHLVIDHTTMEIMMQEAQAYLLGDADQLPEPLPFRNFVAQARFGGSQSEHEAFFRSMLGDVEEPTAPFGLLDAQGDGSGIEEARIELETVLARRLRERARACGVSAASLYHLAWAQALARVSGRDDVVFGTVLFGRMHGGQGADRVLGLFINTLPIRIRVGDQGIEQSLRETHALLAELMRREHASLALAQRCSGVTAPAPLFSSLFNYRHSSRELDQSQRAILAREGIEALDAEERTNYPLALTVDDLGDGFALTAQVVRPIDPGRICELMRTGLERLIEALERAPETAARAIDPMPEAEMRQVLVEWNRTEADYPSEKCVHELFEAQVERTPNAIALIQRDQRLTYGELNARANSLASHLRELGVEPGARVAILLERSIDLVVAEIATLKCGAAYVPIDPIFPDERQVFIAADCAARIVITTKNARLPEALGALRVDIDGLHKFEAIAGNLNIPSKSETTAYVMYTSGSTGSPKGIMTPHRAIGRLVMNCGYAEFNEDDRVAFAANPAFDAATMEVWGPLLNGGRIVIIDREAFLDMRRFAESLEWYGVTTLFLTTAIFNQYAQSIPEVLARVPLLLCGGERNDPASFARVLEKSGLNRLIHCYGPTETTTFAITHEVREVPEGAKDIPLGGPISNTRVYILDANLRPTPIGVIGDIYIGGAGVAQGYVNRPEMTAERFMPDPFGCEPGARLYKTGDLGCWQAAGNIEFLGRNDFQVKVRGFRIELGEIEARLLRHRGVREAVALAREDDEGGKRLVAYYTGEDVGAEALRDYLSRGLPDYMTPSAYVRLESLPLTANGKLDRRALPAPEGQSYVRRGYEPPAGEIETRLALIWANLLKLERVSRFDNFFELGGHSLLAIRMVERMRREGLRANVRMLFTAPTLQALAESVDSGGGDSGGAAEVETPPNLIPPGCRAITPEMLPLVNLTQGEIDNIVARVAGGAANVQDIYPLTALQEGIFFHHLMSAQGDPYLLQSLLAFDTRERLDGFIEAFQAVIARHDILRTSVVWEGLPHPVQVVWREAPLQVEETVVDMTGGDAARRLLERFDPRRIRLDVRQAPLTRCIVAHDESKGRWLMLGLSHHLAIDHSTMDIVAQEAQAYLLGDADQLPEPLPFRNFVAQARLGMSQSEHEAFFRSMLGDVEEPTAPFGLLDAQGDGSGIKEARIELETILARRVRERARASGVSAASLCHLAWAQTLARVSTPKSGRDDVVFGTVLLGRMQSGRGAEKAPGLFINTLPIRIRVGDESVEHSVRQVHALLAELILHEHASLAQAQRCSAVDAPIPLFSSLLNYRHSPREAQPLPETALAWTGIETLESVERTNYPLVLSVDDLGDGFALTAKVVEPIDPDRVCEFMRTALERLVEALETAPETAAREIEVLPEVELRQALVDWNGTEADYPREKCIPELFEAQVERTPNAIALVSSDQSLTYGKLNASANRLAQYLREVGVGPDARVAICMERSIEMVVALLATLKAGGAYAPLDPGYPIERLAYMLQDSAPLILLTHEAAQIALPGNSHAFPILNLDKDAEKWIALSADNPDSADIGLNAKCLAYILYTSGSTGLPKGAMNDHTGIVNRLVDMQRAFGFSADDTMLQKTPFSFDVSVWEFFWPLLFGARLVMALPGGHKDPNYLVGVIQQHNITAMHFVPSMLQVFLEHRQASECRSLVRVMCGGEALPAALARRFYERLPGTDLYNFYGPAETAIDVAAWNCREGTIENGIPIGRPNANTQIYILNAHGQPAPIGILGEIYIGGVQVGRGYFNRSELTADRFLPDPFSRRPGARIYKTGDLGRWLPNGAVEFLGRNDFQIKIRGFRIELGEIEAALSTHPEVREVIVTAHEAGEVGKRLVAYYTGEKFGAETLRAHLSSRLPDYMVPAAYVHLQELPLTPSGKLDRRALPAPEGQAYAAHCYEPPVGEIEISLARIWANVLRLDRVSRHDNFFELGGHSLLAITVIERMRREGLPADVSALFIAPTLRALAEAIDSGRRGGPAIETPPNLIPPGCRSITPEMLPLVALTQPEIDSIVAGVIGGAANVQDIYPLAPLQEGILFHHLMSDTGDAYLLPILLAFHTRERLDGFIEALRAVISRHDILRTAIVWENLSEPVQVVWRNASLAIEEVALDSLDGDAGRRLRSLINPRRIKLDVRRAPLMRCLVANDEANGRWLLLWVSHHLASDHTTLEVMTREVEAHLLGEIDRLPEPLPFRNFVAQSRLGGSQSEHEAFFRSMLGDVEEPTAPFGLLDAQGDGSGIEEARIELETVLARRLRERARLLKVSVASLCHLAWAQALARVSGREDVVFGTVLFGRMRGGEGADQALGLFINTLPIRIRVGEEGVERSVRQVHALLGELMRHEHASLALAQRCSAVAAPAPLFGSLLNYLHSPRQAGPKSEAAPAWVDIDVLYAQERTNYPLALAVDDLGDGFAIVAQAVMPIDPGRICEFMRTGLERLVEALERAPETAARVIDPMPEAELRQALVEWNKTESDYPKEKCVHELFEAQVEKSPEAVALVYEDEQLSYGELNAQANRLARRLWELGVRPEARVAILLERSIDLTLAELAILKCGAAYAPLDLSAPAARRAFMIEDCQAEIVLAGKDLEVAAHAKVVRVDLEALSPAEETLHNLRVPLDSETAAYIMYTSGSTGQPKGVVVPHRAIGRLALNNRYAVFEADDRVAFTSNPAFDASTMEVWAPLLHGGRVVVVPEGVLLRPDALADLLRREEVSILHLVAGLMSAYADSLADIFPRLRYLMTGGDAVDPRAIARVLRGSPPQHLIHCYGPSESTTFATTHEVAEVGERARSIPIGRPIANTQIYLLDSYGQPAPIAAAGEIYIGGAGVARGYLNRAEQTAESFLPDPFGQEAGARIYKTGDLGRWLPEGVIEFLGRRDFQVKIRGFRIELGEIEARLAEHAAVKEAVVLAHESNHGDNQLVAYVVTRQKSGTAIGDSNEWRERDEHKRMQLWPSIGEYFVYDDLIYYGLTNDEPRNLAYQAAFKRSVKDKVVMDIGTGRDAILARLCIEAGAKKVYAIEVLDATFQLAEQRIRDLNLQDRVILIHGDAIKVQLPEKVDVCVSEIFEAIGGAEGAASIINSARRFLKEDGIIIPRLSITKIAAVTLPPEIAENARFSKTSGHYVEKIFEQIGYRFDLRLCVKNFPAANIISSADTFEYLDFDGPVEPEYVREVKLKINRSARLDGFLVWLHLDMGQEEVIDILEGDYSWFPVFLPVFYPGIEVSEGEVIEAVCSGALSENGVNPDYTIKGRLKTKDGSTIGFEYESVHHKRLYQASPFYELLFKDDVTPIERDNHTESLAKSLRNHLGQHLPEYMIPAAYVHLESLPLTPNGKLDRRALPAPEGDAYVRRGYEPPVGEIEIKLAQIWAEVLGLDRVSRSDNFFELGGHSLLVVSLIERMRQQGLYIDIRLFYVTPTLAEIASAVTNASDIVQVPPIKIPKFRNKVRI